MFGHWSSPNRDSAIQPSPPRAVLSVGFVIASIEKRELVSLPRFVALLFGI
jgi:hypothetical protein